MSPSNLPDWSFVTLKSFKLVDIINFRYIIYIYFAIRITSGQSLTIIIVLCIMYDSFISGIKAGDFLFKL